jgi:hypothetical protein
MTEQHDIDQEISLKEAPSFRAFQNARFEDEERDKGFGGYRSGRKYCCTEKHNYPENGRADDYYEF